MLIVLNAVADTTDVTVMQVAHTTGLDRKTVSDLLVQAVEQAGVKIEKEGSAYRLIDWGPVIRPEGARLAADGKLGPIKKGA